MKNIDEKDLKHLQRCVELAKETLAAGNQPFGSVLVSSEDVVLFEAKNEVVTTGDQTRHPEFEIARWAATHMAPEERAKAIVYTSGEHCPMCSAAHGWVGLGRIVYVSSAEQLTLWRAEIGISQAAVQMIPIEEVVNNIEVSGPVAGLAEQIHDMHIQFHRS